MKGRDRLVGAATAILSVLVSFHTHADVLVDTLRNEQIGVSGDNAYYIHNFPPNATFAGDDLRVAIAITVAPGLPYTIDTIALNVAARNRADQRLIVALLSDAAGHPGATIDSMTITNLPVRPDGSGGPITYPLTIVSPPNRLLSQGTYWIALFTLDATLQSDIYWYDRSDRLGRVGNLSSPLNGTGWFVSDSAFMPELRVTATRTPEPGSAILLGSATLLITRRRPR
jgi:hypothetical protein